MLKIRRFNNGTFRSEVSHSALEITTIKNYLSESMVKFSFLIERNNEVSGDEFADLIIQYSTDPRAKFLANLVRKLNLDNPEFITLSDDGSLCFYGFSVNASISQSRLKQYFTIVKQYRFLSRDEFNSKLVGSKVELV